MIPVEGSASVKAEPGLYPPLPQFDHGPKLEGYAKRPVHHPFFNIPKAIAKVQDPILSAQQQDIVDRVLAGENIFFTGSAGTGKSVVLRAIIRALEKPTGWRRKKFAVTASTGIAALNIGGRTVHSWAGIGLGLKPASTLAENILRTGLCRANWLDTDVLILDEGRWWSEATGLTTQYP